MIRWLWGDFGVDKMRNVVKITNVEMNEDGSANVDISYGTPFVKLFKERNPTMDVTPENIGNWFRDLLEDSVS